MIELLKKWFTKHESSPVREVGWYRKLLVWEFISFCIEEYWRKKYPEFDKFAMPAQGFVDRDALYKKNHPRLFWLNNKISSFDAWFEYHILDKLRYPRQFYVNAIRDKTHIVPTGLKMGEWHDSSERLFRGVFELLVFFVEQEGSRDFEYYLERLEKNELDNDKSDTAKKDLYEAYIWYKEELPELIKQKDALYEEVPHDPNEHIFASFNRKDPLRDEIYEDIHSFDWLIDGQRQYYMGIIIKHQGHLWS